jgi:hypothetical protein
MTSRRSTLIEQGAQELLHVHGFTVRVIPPVGFDKRLPPAHIVASHGPDETRYIKIRKISHVPIAVDMIATKYASDIVLFRKHIASHGSMTGLHYEIWVYSLSYGFRCFEVLKDSIREIQKLSFSNPATPPAGGFT